MASTPGGSGRWITAGVSFIVAAAIAVEELMKYGEEWPRKRHLAETLKAEGWQFLQLAGPYRGSEHSDAFGSFAERVEATLNPRGILAAYESTESDI